MRQRIFALFALLLLLAACTPQDAAQAQPQTQTRTLSLFVQNGISQTAFDAIETFAQQTSALSAGALTIEVAFCDDTVATLDGGCDLIFADNAEIARADSDFAAFTSPFYFCDYTHMTTTLNSEEFFSGISERLASLLGASPIAAFYGGSRAFASNESEFLDVWDAWQGMRVTVGHDSTLLAVVLRGLGADVSARDDEAVLSGFLSGSYRTVECDVASLAQISDTRIKNERVYAYRSFHTAQVYWLMLADTTQSSLSDSELAVIKEAAAIALAQNDNAVYAAEESTFSALEALGVPVFETEYDEFNAQCTDIFKSEVRYRNLWDWQVYEALRALTLLE